MPDPVWSHTYSFSLTPEAQSFTRTLYGSPVVTVQTTGPAANRRIEVNSSNGSVVFTTAQPPAFNSAVGATVEAQVSVTGAGNAGFELTFTDMAFGLQVYAGQIRVTIADDALGQQDYIIPTAANTSNTLFRMTVDAQRILRVYRAGAQVAGSGWAIPVQPKPAARALFWAEEGGVQIFRIMRFHDAGAFPPG